MGLSRRVDFDRHVGSIIQAESADDFQQIELQLLSHGFQRAREVGDGAVFVKPKRLGPTEIFAIVIGLFVFLLPGVLYLMMWSRRPPEMVTVRRAS